MHRRLEANRLFERGARQSGIAAELRPLIGIARQTEDRRSERAYGGVDPSLQQGSHQLSGLVGRDLTSVGGVVDGHTDTVRRQSLAAPLILHPCEVGAWQRRFKERVARSKRVEEQVCVREQRISPRLGDPDRVWKNRERIGLSEIENGVEAFPLDQVVDKGPRGIGEGGAQPADHRRR